MKISTVLAALAVCLMITSTFTRDTYAQDVDTAVNKLEWMSGCWVQNEKQSDSFVYETWTKPFGMMIGTNRRIKDGKVRAFEYLRIEARNGVVYYVAKPSSASAETSFKMIMLKKEKVVFENKDHDFPKHIIYSLEGAASLVARVEDDNKGFGLLFNKVSCDD